MQLFGASFLGRFRIPLPSLSQSCKDLEIRLPKEVRSANRVIRFFTLLLSFNLFAFGKIRHGLGGTTAGRVESESPLLIEIFCISPAGLTRRPLVRRKTIPVLMLRLIDLHSYCYLGRLLSSVPVLSQDQRFPRIQSPSLGQVPPPGSETGAPGEPHSRERSWFSGILTELDTTQVIG